MSVSPLQSRWRAFALAGALALIAPAVAVPLLGPAAPAVAAPGAPGVPSPAAVVFDEDFENGPATSPILRLNQYTGTSGQTYTADPAWLSGCNGWLSAAVQATTPSEPVADCGNNAGLWNAVQQTAQALGMLHGQSAQAATANHAVSALTLGALNGQKVELATASNVPLPTSSRFLAFGVDVAAISCNIDHPLMQFFLVNEQGELVPAGSQIDGCASPTTVTVPALGSTGAQTVTVGQYTTNGAVLFSGSSVGIRLINDQPSDFGNDHAFDNIRILDATPQLDKEFLGGWAPSGGTARLRFTVTNTAELGSKPGWSFQDALPDGMTVASPSGATTTCPAGSVSATGSQVSVTGDLSVGMASCTIELDVTAARGTYTNGPDRVSVVGLNPPASAAVVFSQPGLALTKTAGTPVDVNQDGLVDAGDTIPYAFGLENTGDVALSGIVVDDPLLPALTCPTALAAGATASCSADYTITAADEAAGLVDNTATATGTPPAPAPLAVTAPVTTSTAVTAPAPSLTLVKSVDPHDLVEGEPITYSFVLENTGNLPLHDVGITEQSFTGSGPLSPIDCPDTVLPVGGELVCTATYTVTAADLLAGTVDNTAVGYGTPAGLAATPISSAPSTVLLPSPAAPGLTATKTASPGEIHAAGETVTFTVAVENDGNLVVSGLGIEETAFTGTGTTPAFTCGLTRLAPGQHTTCTAPYTATQADVDQGGIQNTAVASGTVEGGAVESPPTTATVTATATASLSVAKTASATEVTAAGQVIRYDFAVENTGGLTLHGLVVDDLPTAPAGPLDAAPACPATTVPPAQTVVCSATYTVTQADVDHGSLQDTATATATEPGGSTVASAPDALTLPVAALSSLTVTKSADATAIQRAGQVIGFTFTVTNDGATTVTGIAVTDAPAAPAGPLDAAPDCPVTTLAPSASVDCTASYTVTQADVDHGSLADEATASGTDAHGGPVTSAPASLRLPSTAVASLTLGPQPAPSSTTLGETVLLTFVATNAGDLTLDDVAITDDRGERVECAPSTLAPGETAVCTAAPTVEQADLDTGILALTATATGTTPFGGTVSSAAVTETVPVSGQVAQLALTKTANAATTVLGQSIAYTFVARNTGTVTLESLTVSDVQAAPAGPLAAEPACDVTRLAPGEVATCTALYTPTAADLRAGSVTDTAVAHALTTLGDPVSSDPATLTVTVAAPVPPVGGSGSAPSGTGTGTSGGGLPSTGSDVLPVLVAGVLALLAGTAIRLLRRRPRPSADA